MKIVIADDEMLARAHLRRMLEARGETVVGEAEDAAEAIQMSRSLRPDLLFLDIQMPGASGLEAAALLQSMEDPPLLVFVTGYSEHALTAFERNALDYLVKPVAPERLVRTLDRARGRLRGGSERPPATSPAAPSPGPPAPPLARLPIREDYTVRFVRIEDIVCAIARDKRVIIRTSEGDKRTYYTLQQLESLLPSDRFLRIHDSCIVNLEQIKELHSLGSHSYAVSLASGQQLPVSRSRYPALQQRLRLFFLPSP